MPKPKPFARPNFPDTIVQDYGKAIIKEVNLIDKLIKEILFPQLDKITNTKSERLDMSGIYATFINEFTEDTIYVNQTTCTRLDEDLKSKLDKKLGLTLFRGERLDSTIRLDLELKQLAGVALVAELIRRVKSKFYGEFLAEDEEPTQKLFTKSTRKLSRTFLDRTKEFTEKKFVSEFKRQTGSTPLPKQMDVDIFVDEATARNVNLIKTLPNRYLSQVTDLVTDAVSKGKLTRDVKEELLKIKETTKNSSRLIARDQISKLVGITNEARQKRLKITHYVWRSMNDSRVRSLSNTNGISSHAHLNGTLQKWGKPPQVVFKGKRAGTRLEPSEDFQCRCFAQPDYSEITGIVHPDVKAAREKSIKLGML